ncbi:hypothetical protein AB7008_43030 [Bradyrhizobium sp. 521_C7_N1_3]|uniref:hypothetical protein n=1 Tax=Bradyrhizobium sp. 521_C7_N1_3 TaxID=3240368 RepID=UPI003F88CA22
MPGMKRIIVALALGAFPFSAFADDGCMYANQKFSVGSTRCECPSIKIDNIDSTGEKGLLTSRRLSCAKDGSWVDTASLCVEMTGLTTRPEFYRLSRMYCPMALNPEEAEKTLAEASDPVAQGALKGVCNLLTVNKKLGNLSEPCKLLIDAFAH